MTQLANTPCTSLQIQALPCIGLQGKARQQHLIILGKY